MNKKVEDILNSIEVQKNIHKKISLNNNTEIELTAKLKILLFNLQIEGAHLKEKNGIGVIAIELQKIIAQLHDSTYDLVKTDRQHLVDANEKIYSYLHDYMKTLEQEE